MSQDKPVLDHEGRLRYPNGLTFLPAQIVDSSGESILSWRTKDLAAGKSAGCSSSSCLTAVCPIKECVCHCPNHIGHGKLQKKNRRIDEYLEDGADKAPTSILLRRLWA